MRIAIVGTGISGLVAAHRLHRDHELTLFEANDRIGGHTHTVRVDQDGETFDVDTGFIVFNDRTYPNFRRLLDELDVADQPTAMSFSVKCERTGLEYNGTDLNGLFAQRRNVFRPSFWRMIREILRFNREAPKLLDDPAAPATLGEFLSRGRYSREFVEHYLVPMGAAVWSTDPVRFREFPARFFVRFFHNHGMLSVNDRPQWRVVRGGSQRYVEKLVAPFRVRIRLRCPVEAIRRGAGHVTLRADGDEARFDHVVVATHSDTALRLLADPTPAEREVLGALPYQRNEVVLHTDASILPVRRRAWAAWNYHLLRDEAHVAVTYNMNILQSLRSPRPFLVTLNRHDAIDPARVLRSFVYDHPLFTPASIEAQRRWDEVSGVARTHYCGAYWGNGFHEDGVNSALRVCHSLEKVHEPA